MLRNGYGYTRYTRAGTVVTLAMLCVYLLFSAEPGRTAPASAFDPSTPMHGPFLVTSEKNIPLAPPPPDPGTRDAGRVTTTSYDLGDEAFRPPGFPIRVELRAEVYYPTGLPGGNYPLIIFLHGRHAPCQRGGAVIPPYNPRGLFRWPCRTAHVPPKAGVPIDSHRGYAYLGEVLASHGFIVVSISANGINARDNDVAVADAGMSARADLIQEHIKLWNTFNLDGRNTQFGGRFIGKVDLTRVGTMGHSRGGQGVVLHYNRYNGALLDDLNPPLLGTTRLGIKGVFPLAPTDFARDLINSVPMAVLLPYCDGDLANLQGIHYFDDTRYNVDHDPAPKHSILVIGANHNYYNTVWTPPNVGGDDDWDAPDLFCDTTSPIHHRLSEGDQQGTALAYLSAFFRANLLGQSQFFPFLTGEAEPPASAAGAEIYVSYHPPKSLRLDLNRLTEDPFNQTRNNVWQAGAANNVVPTNLNPETMCGLAANCVRLNRSILNPGPDGDITEPHVAGLNQLRIGWDTTNNGLGAYENKWPVVAAVQQFANVSGLQRLQFRAGVNFGEPDPTDATGTTPLAPEDTRQDFTATLIDDANRTADVQVQQATNANQRRALYYPPAGFSEKVLLNMIAIPLSEFTTANAALDLTRIKSVKFTFNRAGGKGALLVSDIFFAGTAQPPTPTATTTGTPATPTGTYTATATELTFTPTVTRTPTHTRTGTPSTTTSTRTVTHTRTATNTVSPTPALTPGACGYVFSISNSMPIEHGSPVTDIGNHCNGCNTFVVLPFDFQLYDQTFNAAYVSSNGTLQFNSDTTDQQVTCLPDDSFDYTVFAHWADLDTSTAFCLDCGIFVSTSDTAPNRIFNIEWRALRVTTAGPVNFEVRLYENASPPRFDIIYAAVDGHGGGAVVGVQQEGGSSITQYECNTDNSVVEGLKLSFALPPCGLFTPTGTRTPSATRTITRTPASTDTPEPTESPTLTETATHTRTPSNITPTPCMGVVTIPGFINAADPLQTGRLTRNINVAQCNDPLPKTCPDPANATPVHYKAYTFINSTGGAQCYEVSLATSCFNENSIFSAAYRGSFDPANICDNYLGDPGYSPSLANPSVYSFEVDDGETFVIVVHEVDPGVGCSGYTLTVTCGTPTPTPTKTRTITPTATLTHTPTRTPTRTITPTVMLTHTSTRTTSPTAMLTPFTPTFTPTRTITPTITPTSAPGGIINGHLTWNGISQPNTRNIGLTATVTLCNAGVPVNYVVTCDTNGSFSLASGLPDGTYNWLIKGPKHLANSGSLTIVGGVISQEFGKQRAGDSNNNNIVNTTDFGILRLTFGSGCPSPDLRADFNNDCIINSTDFTLLKNNFGQGGAAANCP